MKEWKMVKLGDIGEFLNGLNFSRELKGFGMKLINVKDIFEGMFINFDSLDKVDLENKKSIEKYFVKEGDLFFVRSSVKREGVGLVSLAKKSDLNTVHCGFIIRFRITSSEVDNLFLTYLLRSPYYRQSLIGVSGGSAITNLSQKALSRLKVKLPPLSIQKKIASILSAYDDLIEINTRRIKVLEEMAQSIYVEWFVKFRFPGHEKVRLVKSEIGMIPEGWEVKKLSEVVKTQYGYTESAVDEEIGPKFLRGTDINKTTYIDWATVPFCQIDLTNYEKYKLNKGDIVVIRMADPGKVGIIEKDINAVFASYLIRLKIISDDISPYYLFYFLLSDRYQGYITGASTGTTRKSASAKVVTDIEMLIPSKKLMNQFESTVRLLREKVNLLLEKNNNLKKTRDFLLPKLISGEIDVSKINVNFEGV